MTLEIDAPDDTVRYWQGTCVSCEYFGLYEGFGFFQAKVRPFLWFLTQVTDCRIFQEKTALDIVQETLRKHGFSDFEVKAQRTLETRTYCVQYRETDFDFISRLMEEDGIYYFFTHDDKREKMIIADDISAHAPVPGHETLPYAPREEAAGYRRKDDHVFEWRGGEATNSGKVSLTDFNFERPSADLMTTNMIPRGTHSHRGYERYDYPGRYLATAHGDRLSRNRMEAISAQRRRSRGQSNARMMGIGQRFELTGHPRAPENAEYLIVSCRHQMQIDSDYDTNEVTKSVLGGALQFNKQDNPDTYRCTFDVMPTAVPYRPLEKTPKPRIPGVQTAMVVGPSGKEIHTDQYGRVKVQFHWDRIGTDNENSSCWVRYAVPWSGKRWGWVGVPRIGQEVVIGFEEGDPDRPMITGMLYNAETMPTYELPANMTQVGIKTNSSKGGNGANELMFEDKKDQELVRFVAEKDYEQTVKNNATVTIGYDKMDAGNLIHKVYQNRTEEVDQGDYTRTIKTGSETIDIAQNRTKNVGNNETVDIGNELTITAGTKITLKVGQSKIVMDATSITLTSMDITCTADMGFAASGGMSAEMTSDMSATVSGGMSAELSSDLSTNVKGTMTDVSGEAMLTLGGGVVMIN
jgi:type VI secretion system secreted protein VgrG